jgi:hypothetical protein
MVLLASTEFAWPGNELKELEKLRAEAGGWNSAALLT